MSTTNTIMNLSSSSNTTSAVQQGQSSDSIQSVKTVDKASASAAKQKSGDTSFDKALSQAKDTQPAKDDKASPASEQDSKEAESLTPKDPLAMTLAAAQQSTTAVDAKQKEATGTAPTENETAAEDALLAAMSKTAKAPSWGQVLQGVAQQAQNGQKKETATTEPATVGQLPTQEFSTGSLDALLPQDAVKVNTNQQLLAMLSGKALTNVSAATDSKSVSTANTQQITSVVEATAVNNNNNGLLTSLKGLPVSTSTPVSDTKQEDTKQDSSLINLLQGANLQVEDRRGQQSSLMQQGGQPQQQQDNAASSLPQTDKKASEDGQPSVAQTMLHTVMQQSNHSSVQTTSTETAQISQLPEEAALDRAPLMKTNAEANGAAQNAQNLSGASNGIFQQSLQDATAAGSTNGTVNQPQTDYEVPRQIVEQAKLVRSTEDTQMVIKLKPEHLGELTLKVSVSANGSVNAAFHTDNAQVRGIIENSMVQLKQELQAQGIKVDNVGVYAGLADGSLPDRQQNQAAYQQQKTSARSQKIDMASFEEETLAGSSVAAVAGVGGTDGIDYRI